MNSKKIIVLLAISLGSYVLADVLINYFIYQNPGFGIPFLQKNLVLGLLPGVLVILLFGFIFIRNSALPSTGKAFREDNSQIPEADLQIDRIPEMFSHQLKTSMTTILGFSGMMRKGMISEKSRQIYNEYIFESSKTLLDTYKNLLDLQRLSDQESTIRIEKCYLEKLFDSLRKKLTSEGQWNAKNHFIWDIPTFEKPDMLVVYTDREKLGVILENLLQNAQSFTKEGIIEAGFHIENKKIMKFFVKDSGKTLPMVKFVEAYRNYLRYPKRLDASFDLATLRLMVAKGYVEAMGGELWSDNNNYNGTTYYFTIPLVRNKEKKKTADIEKEYVPDWSNRTLLVAEDVDANFILLKELLRQTKINLVWAKNGMEAINYFKESKKPFDAVLLDIIMPEVDGFEAASAIRKMNPVMPIIGQTAYSLENDDDIHKLTNFNDFLTKPIWYYDLVHILQKYLDNNTGKDRKNKGMIYGKVMKIPSMPGMMNDRQAKN